MVDLPEENREAAVNAITLPEVFHNFENFQIDLEDLELEEQLANSMVSGRSFRRCSDTMLGNFLNRQCLATSRLQPML